jgi:catechol 2,3-dioxygenase-like lactoylglutathione lyase family enzyme
VKPSIKAVLETPLYVDDLDRARRFYQDVLGLEAMIEDDRFSGYAVGATVLLLFAKSASNEPVVMKLGTIPPHGGEGRLHIAFAVDKDELAAWEARLAEHQAEIEGRVRWPKGGESIYFRDPDGHLLELATPGLWKNY